MTFFEDLSDDLLYLILQHVRYSQLLQSHWLTRLDWF